MSEVPGPEFPETELGKEEVSSPQEKLTPGSPKSEEFPPGFSEHEKEHLQFLRDQAEKGEIGGPQDSPSEGREFTKRPKFPEEEQIDPAWKNLSPDLRADFLARFGLKSKPVSGREASYSRKSKEGFYSLEVRGSPSETIFRLIQKYYPQFGLIIKEEVDLQGRRVEGILNVSLDPKKEMESRSKLDHLLISNPIIFALHRVLFEEEEGIIAISKSLTRQGLLSEEVSRRLLAKSIENIAKESEAVVQVAPGLERHLDRWRRGLQVLGVEPFSDHEFESLLLEKVIIPEFGPPANA